MRKLRHREIMSFAQESQFIKWIQTKAAWFFRSTPLTTEVYTLSVTKELNFPTCTDGNSNLQIEQSLVPAQGSLLLVENCEHPPFLPSQTWHTAMLTWWKWASSYKVWMSYIGRTLHPPSMPSRLAQALLRWPSGFCFPISSPAFD